MDKELIQRAQTVCYDIKIFIHTAAKSKRQAFDYMHDRFISQFCPTQNDVIIDMVIEIEAEINKKFSE